MPLSPRTNPGHGDRPPRYPGAFMLAFREAVAGLKWQITKFVGDAAECLDEQGRQQVVGLENLYRRARHTGRGDWPGLIADFLKQAALSDQPNDLPTDLADVADRLLPRLGPPFTRKIGEGALWSQQVAGPELMVNLVIDYPNRMIYVTEELVKNSGKPGKEWLDIALANLRRRTPDDALQPLDTENGLMNCSIADAYDSSRALLLEELLPTGKANGFFVGLPGRDQLLVIPVSRPAVAFVHILKLLVDKHFKTMPYPISNQVYWVRGGMWLRFPIAFEGNEVTIAPPEEFNEVLARIGIPEEEEEDTDEPEE
jgi:hypothetical protein